MPTYWQPVMRVASKRLDSFTKNILIDLSKKTELRWLSELTRQIQIAADDLPFFMVGAMARDLLLQHIHGIHTGRQTRDIDFAFLVESWDVFERVRLNLLAAGKFTEARDVAHRLYFDKLIVDLVPFGAVERADRTIAWPPDGSTILNVTGFKEALQATILVSLPDKISVRVAGLPALALLKMSAWEGRRLTESRKDAYDLTLILRHYLDAGNRERFYSEAAHLLEQPDFDYEMAGAWLLGRDIASLLSPNEKARLVLMLEKEADPKGALHLAGDMPVEIKKAIALIGSLKTGISEH